MTTLSLGFSPCPNDTFMFHGLVHGRPSVTGVDWRVVMQDIEALNLQALEQPPRLDVTKLDLVSSHAEVIVTPEQLERLAATGLEHRMAIEDLARFYAARLAASAGQGPAGGTYGTWLSPSFGNGGMGGYYTLAEIESVLEEQCQPAGSSRPFLHLGVSEGFSYDLATSFDGATGDCVSATITNMMLNGSPIDMAATYLITVNSFLSTGGDNFTTFADVNAAAGLDGGVDLSALTNYLGTFGPVAPPSTDRVNELP